MRVYVEDTPIDWPLTIELIRDAQAERGAEVDVLCAGDRQVEIRGRRRPAHNPLLDISMVVPTQAEGE